LDAGTLASLRDDPTPDAPAYAHLRACPACAASLSDATARAAVVSEALAALDAPLDLAAAKAATRARLDRVRASRQAGGWRRWPIGRAAMLLLTTAGAASALTWTPIRRLFTPRETPPVTAVAPAPLTAPPAVQQPEATGIAFDVGGAGIEVIVRGATPGSVLEVAWGAGASARVQGPIGTRYTFGDGRLELEAEAGDLRLELPRSAASSVVVDGRVYVTRSATGVSVGATAVERTDDLVRFVVPAP
jgi:hypothetical protein